MNILLLSPIIVAPSLESGDHFMAGILSQYNFNSEFNIDVK
jgi:hypothetical protein